METRYFGIQINQSGTRAGGVYATIKDGKVVKSPRNVKKENAYKHEYRNHRHMLDIMFEIKERLQLTEEQVKYTR